MRAPPYFAAALHRRDHPGLAAVPLALVGADGRVAAVSAEADAAGVAPGMAEAQARALCPGAHLAPEDPRRTRRALEALLAALAAFSDFVELEDAHAPRADGRRRADPYHLPPGQLDAQDPAACCLDLGRAPRDEVYIVATELLRAVRGATALAPAQGFAAGRFPARVAAAATQPGEAALILPGLEAAFLADFPSALLPVDGETLRQLGLLGLDTLGQVAALPERALVDRFGPPGRAMHRLARGHDTSPVARYVPPRVERLTRALDGPVADRGAGGAAGAPVRRAGGAARGRRGGGARLTLALDLEGGATVTRDVALRQPAATAAHLAETAAALLAGRARDPRRGRGHARPLRDRAGDGAAAQPVPARPRPGGAAARHAPGPGGALRGGGLLLAAPDPARRLARPAARRPGAGGRAMTYLYGRGERITVEADAAGAPRAFTWRGRAHPVRRIARQWRVDDSWWRARVWRAYYKLATHTGLLVVVYQDLSNGDWWLERLYD
ncbi:MAG: DUF6504 family protein [Anaerolineae bacterium]|nr:DUF6504 family protein [Anaerolineae bacterium]